MSEVAIRVENLGKRYRIGAKEERYDTLSDALLHSFTKPVEKLYRWCRPSAARGNDCARDDVIWALKDVSFEVKRGEVVGIIGRNGAGKTTLLKILSRITEPTEGRAEIYGRVGSLLEVGTGFHPELTGRENIYLNGAILGMKKEEIDRKFDEIVEFSGVAKFIDTPVKRYSSGMYVRLAFAVAAHLEPEILLVDEVLAVGDAEFQAKCLGKMQDVAEEGRTVLFVSHNMSAILRLCERALLLDGGHIFASGCVEDVVAEYLAGSVEQSGEVVIPREVGGYSEEFRFCSLRILGPDGGPSAQVPLTNGVYVEIEYEVSKSVKGANVALHLWNSSGVCVLSSTDIDQGHSPVTKVRQPGRYMARCYIPQEYLRVGRYFVGVSCSIPRLRVLADLPRVLAFDVIDTGSVELKTGQGRQGVIAPVLEWITQQVEAYGDESKRE